MTLSTSTEGGTERSHHFAIVGQIEGLYDTSVLTKKGDVIPVDITGSPVKYAGRTLVQGIFRDITDHTRMEDELKMHRDQLGKLVADRTARIREEVARRKKKEEQYLALVESVREWIWETDGDFVHTYVSSRVYDVLGYSPEEVIGKSPFDFIPPEERTRALTVLKDLLSRKQHFATFQTMARHKEGHSIYIQASGIPGLTGGKLLGYRVAAARTYGAEEHGECLKERERELVVKSQTLEEVNAGLNSPESAEEDRKELRGSSFPTSEMILPYILKMQKGQRDPRAKRPTSISSRPISTRSYHPSTPYATEPDSLRSRWPTPAHVMPRSGVRRRHHWQYETNFFH